MTGPTVHAIRLARIGKESNPIADTGDLVLDRDDRAVEYREPYRKACRRTLQGRQRLWCTDACRKRAQRRPPQ
jgi:hypothetical protein